MGNVKEKKQSLIVGKLLKKIGGGGGFAGFGKVAQTTSLLIDGDAALNEIAAAILYDPILTFKLLYLVNSITQEIGSHNNFNLDQILVILGLDTVKSVALSFGLPGLPTHMEQQLHAEIVVANFSANLATEITRINAPRYNLQEARICGLMQNLGRLISIYYIYEDIEQCRQLQIERNITEDEAMLQKFGANFESIGFAIAHHLKLPDVLQACLASDTVKTLPPSMPNTMAWHKECSLFSRRMARILFRLPEKIESVETVKCINLFQKTLQLNEKDTPGLIEKCLLETEKILSWLAFPETLEDVRNFLRRGSEIAWDILPPLDLLAKDKNNSGQSPFDLIKGIMHRIHNYCNFDCTLICQPAGSFGLVAIAGIGRKIEGNNIDQLNMKFRSSKLKQDIFGETINNKHDTFIANTHSPEYANLIPDWYHEIIGAQSFVMLPLLNADELIGMIYGDYSKDHMNAPPRLAEGNMLEWRNTLIQLLSVGIEVSIPKPPEVSIPKPHEIILQLIYHGNQFTLDSKQPSLNIGRSKQADIVIHDRKVSRMHAKIIRRNGRYVFIDFSFNGSCLFIHGETEIHLQHEEYVLRGSGRIFLGYSHFLESTEIIEFSHLL